MDTSTFMDNLLAVIPYWEYGVMKPFARYARQSGGSLSVNDYYLLHVVRHHGGLTMTEVARRLSTTKQQASLKVDRMCERGYLKRVSSPGDRRVITVEVTAQALEETDAYRAHIGGFADVLCQKLDDKDMETFNTAMEMLLSVMPKLD